MTTRVLMAAGLVALLAGGTAVVMAQPSQGGPGRAMRGGHFRGPGGPLGDLGLSGVELTEAQRDQVRSIQESHKAEFDQVATKLREAQRALAEATHAEPVDEAAIRASSAVLASAMADQAVLSAKIRAEVRAILTAEQLEAIKQRRSERRRQ